MIYYWLTLSFPALLGILILAFASIAVSLVLLSFVFGTSPTIRSFKGVVAPFVGAVAVIFAILLGFLASDIWDRERRAASAVRTEAESLLSLATLAKTFDLPREPLAGAKRGWPGARAQRCGKGNLFREVAIEWQQFVHRFAGQYSGAPRNSTRSDGKGAGQETGAVRKTKR